MANGDPDKIEGRSGEVPGSQTFREYKQGKRGANGSSRWNGNYGSDETKRRSMYQVNKPRDSFTKGEQEFTRHPSKEWGYAGTGKRATDDE